MKIKIDIEGKKEIERILAILELGLLTALENNLISIEESEGYLFNPYTMRVMKDNEINESIIDIIHRGCELEDIQSLLPDKLFENVVSLKIKCINVLRELDKPSIPTNKLIKDISR